MGGLAVAAHEDLEGHHHGRQQRGATGQAVCAPGHRGDEAKGKFVDSIMFSIIQLDDKKHIKIHLKKHSANGSKQKHGKMILQPMKSQRR